MVDSRDAGETEGSFKVTDHRKFTSEGEVRLDNEVRPDTATGPTEREVASVTPGEVGQTPQPERGNRDPSVGSESVDFSAFILSLASTGMVHLGEIPEHATGQKAENLSAARQMIGMLAILKEKTSGNLTAEENHLLESLLYELRMKFLEKSNPIKL